MPAARAYRTPKIRQQNLLRQSIIRPRDIVYPISERDFCIDAILTLQRLDNVISIRVHDHTEAAYYRILLPFAKVHRSKENLYHFLTLYRFSDTTIEKVQLLAKRLGHTVVRLYDNKPQPPIPRCPVIGEEANPIVIEEEEIKGQGSATDPIILDEASGSLDDPIIL